MMRLALVVLFLIGLALIPRHLPLGTAPYKAAPEPVVATKPAAEPSDAATVPSESTSAPTSEPQTAVLPDSASPQSQTGDTVEKPGEQRTSSTARPDGRSESIEVKVQKELVRLACYTGKQENRWGGRSRSALRRFTARARPKTGGVVSQGLLDIMAAYPSDYCRSCRPGERACDIGGGRRRSELTSPPQEVSSDVSYLPPWMRGETVAIEVAVVPTSERASLTKPSRKAQRRKATRHARGSRTAMRQARLPRFLRSAWFMPY